MEREKNSFEFDQTEGKKETLTEKRTDNGGTYNISTWRNIVRIIEATSHKLLQGGITLKHKKGQCQYTLFINKGESAVYLQQGLIFTQVIQSVKHLNNNKDSHWYSWGMSILKYTAWVSCFPCWARVEIHLQNMQKSEFRKEYSQTH